MTPKLLALLCVIAGFSCGLGATACPDLAAANFTVTVLDAATSQRICDATVTATETSTGSTMSLSSFGGTTGCTYSGGFYERAGTFSLSATKTGYLSTTQTGVTVVKGQCNIVGVPLTLNLTK